jgi:DNA-binding NarL/FixJ family response regulator
MPKDILVGVIEDDVFSRNWMALMLVRDWRTRLIGEFSNWVELCAYMENSQQNFDVFILDVDMFGEPISVNQVCETMSKSPNPCKLLLTGIQPDQHILRQINNEQVCGYVLKEEVGYSLSWIISFVANGNWVMTPGSHKLAYEQNFTLPEDLIILDGRKNLPGFTNHEAEVARFAFIFSLGRRDLADELKISEQWSYGLVSEIYKKMGLSEILSGEVDLFSFIPDSPIIREHFKTILQQLDHSTKARDMETLAFHLLTMPEIIK